MRIECRQLAMIRRDAFGKEHHVLRDVNAFFESGRMILIQGPTGSGKSTLLHLIGGLLRPTRGEVIGAGKPISRWTSAHRSLWRRNVGILFQQLYLLSDLTALENVVLPLIPKGSDMTRIREKALSMMRRIGMSDHAWRKVWTLSGGEQQRVSLARALIHNPPLLLIDEPTAYQDAEGASRILGILCSARDRGATVIIASHDPRILGHAQADDQWCLLDGRLEAVKCSGTH